MFIDGLIQKVRALGLGLHVDGQEEETLGILGYADDLVVLCESRADLQIVLDALGAYASKWRFEINRGKTKVVVFGKAPGRAREQFTFRGEEVAEVEEYKYLGMWTPFKHGCIKKGVKCHFCTFSALAADPAIIHPMF